MKSKMFKRTNKVLVAAVVSASILAGGVSSVIGALTTKSNIGYAYDSNYAIDQSKIGCGKTYYVAPNGTDANIENSSAANPANIVTLLSREGQLKPGDKVIVAPGTYHIDMPIKAGANGSASGGYITIINESPTEKATLDFSAMRFGSTMRGVELTGDFWYWYGVDICGAGDNGLYIGGSYNIIENCEFYNNRDTGLQLGRSYSEYNSITQWPSYNLIKNCTSYNNYDNETYGENADGFAAKLTVGYGNIFDGCIAYRNSDDGWDLYAKADSGNIGAVIMYNCVAFENGFLAETQAEFNAKCGGYDENGQWVSSYNTKFDEPVTDSYLTRDGDGNGFKLGGSVMEGDVYLYNCQSFNNRMHGVTDNSNPGVLSVANVTAYNNAALIDNNPESQTFGEINVDAILVTSEDSCNNIDLSRQTYSYNIISGIVSVNDGSENLGADRYRGSVEYSNFLSGDYKSVRIAEAVDASFRNESYAVRGTSAAAIPMSVFASVPNVTALSGKKNTTIHKTYRNADGSVNMHDILKIVDYSKFFGDSRKIGADLTKTSWEDYTHYSYYNASNAASNVDAALECAKATLDLNTNVNATFQDFDLVTIMEDVTITWESSDTSVIDIKEGEYSVSRTRDARAIVYRGATDQTVTLTAIIKANSAEKSVTREYEVVVKADVPTIGDAIFEGVEDGLIIFDRYAQFDEPKLQVRNAADYNGKLLDESRYTVESTYMYATSKNAHFVPINHFTTAVPGVYTITKKVTMSGTNQLRVFSYTIYVAGNAAEVDFMQDEEGNGGTVNVNQHGYLISGEVTSAVGYIYSLSSPTKLTDMTAEKLMTEGQKYNFRSDKISFQFPNENTGNYYIYYVLGNNNGAATSQVKEVAVETVEISTVAQFKAMLLNSNSSKIYKLTADLDLSGEKNWAGTVTSQKKNFVGLLNGMGHTISGLSVTGNENEFGSLFYRLSGGTIENVKFKDITIKGKEKVGLIATSYGGYVYNVQMENVRLECSVRGGALIGQVLAGTTYVDQVSLINPKTYTKQTNVKESDFDAKTFYTKDGDNYIRATSFVSGTEYYTLDEDLKGDRIGGILGFIQASSGTDSSVVHISNCYVDAVFGTGIETYAGSIVGRYDDRNAKDYLSISKCYSNSIMRANKYQGGIIGGQTGAGKLRMDHCVFDGELYYAGDLSTQIYIALKNCSGIMGYFAQYGDTQISMCFARIEEYNTNYDVDNVAYINNEFSTRNFWTTRVGFDFVNRWSIAETPNLTAPYVTLNFLGDWN